MAELKTQVVPLLPLTTGVVLRHGQGDVARFTADMSRLFPDNAQVNDEAATFPDVTPAVQRATSLQAQALLAFGNARSSSQNCTSSPRSWGVRFPKTGSIRYFPTCIGDQ